MFTPEQVATHALRLWKGLEGRSGHEQDDDPRRLGACARTGQAAGAKVFGSTRRRLPARQAAGANPALTFFRADGNIRRGTEAGRRTIALSRQLAPMSSTGPTLVMHRPLAGRSPSSTKRFAASDPQEPAPQGSPELIRA